MNLFATVNVIWMLFCWSITNWIHWICFRWWRIISATVHSGKWWHAAVLVFLCFRQCIGRRHYISRVFVHACVDFEHKYLWNGWRYRQSVNCIISCDLSHVEQNKKFELMLTRRVKAYSSFCSQVIIVYLHPFHCSSLFCGQKSPKKIT